MNREIKVITAVELKDFVGQLPNTWPVEILFSKLEMMIARIARIWGAFSDGRLVGVVLLVNTNQASGERELASLYVLQDYRRFGIGRELFEAAVSECLGRAVNVRIVSSRVLGWFKELPADMRAKIKILDCLEWMGESMDLDAEGDIFCPPLQFGDQPIDPEIEKAVETILRRYDESRRYRRLHLILNLTKFEAMEGGIFTCQCLVDEDEAVRAHFQIEDSVLSFCIYYTPNDLSKFTHLSSARLWLWRKDSPKRWDNKHGDFFGCADRFGEIALGKPENFAGEWYVKILWSTEEYPDPEEE